MDTQAELLYARLMLRDKEIIANLQAENAQLKELLNKPMKYYHGIILLGILVAIYIK